MIYRFFKSGTEKMLFHCGISIDGVIGMEEINKYEIDSFKTIRLG